MSEGSKKLFLSYAHEDRATAEQLALALRSKGEDVWLDKWEIKAGDSLIQKIFAEGLAEADGFLILLSRASVDSKWVKEELNAATLRRIEELTRVIPILIDDVELPLAVRVLKWVDLREGLEAGVRQVINALHGVTEKPQLGQTPAYLQRTLEPVGGLSAAATTVGMKVLLDNPPDGDQGRAFGGPDIAEATQFNAVEINDAVDELEAGGLVRVVRTMGTSPFTFYAVEPTYLLYQAFAGQLDYSPDADIRTVIAATAALGRANAQALHTKTGLSVGRLNKAVDHVREYGLAEVTRHLGTRPYEFGEVRATRVTRQLAESFK